MFALSFLHFGLILLLGALGSEAPRRLIRTQLFFIAAIFGFRPFSLGTHPGHGLFLARQQILPIPKSKSKTVPLFQFISSVDSKFLARLGNHSSRLPALLLLLPFYYCCPASTAAQRLHNACSLAIVGTVVGKFSHGAPFLVSSGILFCMHVVHLAVGSNAVHSFSC
jgi:hypothetical protein